MATTAPLDIELENKPDAALVCRRMEAWWERAIIDRPTIQVTAPRPNPRPLPVKQHETLRDRWMDVETPNGPFRALRPPMDFSSFEPANGPIPALGEHTDAIKAWVRQT